MTKKKSDEIVAAQKAAGPTDEELMLAIRENLIELVKLMNFGLSRKIKTLFTIRQFDPAKQDNPDAPYVLLSLEMLKKFHNGQS